MKTEEINFGSLGPSFQLSLLKVIIEDRKFSETIIDVMESKYFDGPYFRYLMENIKEFFGKYNKIPSYDTLNQKIMSENGTDGSSKVHIDTLDNIRNHEIDDNQYVKDCAINFCKQQVFKKAMKDVDDIIKRGEFENYKNIEEIIQKALQVGVTGDDAVDIFKNVEAALDKDSRVPFPLGIDGLDRLLKGGLARGELGVIIAPTGVGKTTLLTKIANSAYIHGATVLHIFFEDNLNSVMRKHYTIMTGFSPDQLPDHKEEVMATLADIQTHCRGKIKLLKMPSDGTSVSTIKQKIRKLIAEGFIPDLLVIDYVDCISPDKIMSDDEWKGEGKIMRSIETMCSEFDIATWVATQGSRESIKSEVVTTDQMGGSIKKAQIGHVIISVAKSLEQKEHGLANMTLLKSRIGSDGIIFTNCTFNNEFIIINTDSENTMLGHTEERREERANRGIELFKANLERMKQQERNKFSETTE